MTVQMSNDCRILVVDDEPHGVQLLVRGLRKLGRVDTALSGEEGWARVQAEDSFIFLLGQRRFIGFVIDISSC